MKRVSAPGLVLALLGFSALVSGCGSDKVSNPVPPPLPELVTSVHPPGRSFGVPYDSVSIFADFAEPLDSTTVTTQNVFLKINTRRLPITVRREDGGRRLRIVSSQAFLLAETYTVELKPDLRTEQGNHLPETYWWQFTITGLRRFDHPGPAPGATNETRFAPLTWDATEAGAGPVSYEVHAGPDSAAVAGSTTPLASGTSPWFVPFNHPWAVGSPVYWRVVGTNSATEERVAGPVWRFDVAPPGAPIDSASMPSDRWGYRVRTTSAAVCMDRSIQSGANNVCVAGWNWAPLAGRRVIGARIDAASATSTTPVSLLFTTTTEVNLSPCNIPWPGPPFADRFLAQRIVPAPLQFRFQGDTLATYVAAVARGIPIPGLLFRSDATASYAAPPILTYYYYR